MSLVFFSVLLTGCAGEVKQRPGVLEAKSCMVHRNTSLEDFKDYVIRSCTHNGVWEVERIDIQSGAMIARYDFVNREYMGLDTGGAALPIESLGGSQERDFFSLQKSLNAALLK